MTSLEREGPPTGKPSPTPIPEGRPLSGPERRLLERLLQHGYPEAAGYVHQMPNVTVVSRCACGCPTIRFAVSNCSTSLGSDQTILAERGGVSPEGVRFGIYLLGREGLISELEVYPISGDGPFTLPPVEGIEVT